MPLCLGFSVGAGDPNSDPHACMANTLPTEAILIAGVLLLVVAIRFLIFTIYLLYMYGYFAYVYIYASQMCLVPTGDRGRWIPGTGVKGGCKPPRVVLGI